MIWDYIIIGAISGFSFSTLGWLSKKANKNMKDRWEEFDPLKATVTATKHAIGAGIGVFFLPMISGLQPSVELAMLCGFVGKDLFEVVKKHAKNLYEQ